MGTPGCRPYIKVRGIDTDWKSIAPSYKQSRPQFVSENSFLLSGTRIRLMQVDGKVVFKRTLLLSEAGGTGPFPRVTVKGLLSQPASKKVLFQHSTLTGTSC